MTHRIMIEFVVDVPNEGVVRDVDTRLSREHYAHLCEVLKSITGFDPLRAPSQPGLFLVREPVTWSDREKDWVGEDDEDDD